MMWIRQLVARRMNGEDVSILADGEKCRCSNSTRRSKIFVEIWNAQRVCETSRGSRRSFMKRIMPSPPRLVAKDGSNMLPCGVTANDLSLSVETGTESFRSYLSKITRLYTWGGEPECYVASLVLNFPLIVPEKGEPHTRCTTVSGK